MMNPRKGKKNMNSSPKAWLVHANPVAAMEAPWRECLGARSTRSFLKVPGQVSDGQLVEPVVAVHRRGRGRRRLPHR